MSSYVEHVVGEYYKKLGYFISPRWKYVSEKWGWKDIDLLAVNESEVLAIECKGGEKNHCEMAEKVIKDFAQINKHVNEKIPLAKGKGRKNILVVAFTLSPKKLEDYLRSNSIEVRYLKDLMRDFLNCLHKEWKESKRKGKEEDFVTRTLKELIIYEWIKDDVFS